MITARLRVEMCEGRRRNRWIRGLKFSITRGTLGRYLKRALSVSWSKSGGFKKRWICSIFWSEAFGIGNRLHWIWDIRATALDEDTTKVTYSDTLNFLEHLIHIDTVQFKE